ncbi:hypothetical protein ACFSTC_40490 [Nonomuraea ferruginea]
MGYKQLLEVERGWRDMKQIIDLRPVYHRLEERIRAHVILCWLALLLMRIIETTTGGTWPACRRELERLHLGTFTGPAGLFRQVTALTKPQQDLLAKLAVPRPPSRSSTCNQQHADQHEHHRLEKRSPGGHTHVSPAQAHIRTSMPLNYAERGCGERLALLGIAHLASISWKAGTEMLKRYGSDLLKSS